MPLSQHGSLTGHVSVVIWIPGNSLAEAIGGQKGEADFGIADKKKYNRHLLQKIWTKINLLYYVVEHKGNPTVFRT